MSRNGSVAVPTGWPRPLAMIAALVGHDDNETLGALAAAMSEDDWSQFSDLVIKRHRLTPLVAHRLGKTPVPDEIRQRITAEARLGALETLEQIAETRVVGERFAAYGIEPVLLKGWPLAERLFGDPGHRHARDLDLLVPIEKIGDSCTALAELGYRPLPQHRRYRLIGSRALFDECKEVEFSRQGTNRNIELHWRLFHFRGWPDPLGRPGAIVRHETQTGWVLCPSDQANLIYLSVHGALHLWFRLKWLVDIDRLARIRGEDGLAADIEAAEEIGARSSVVLALRLAARVFGTPVPPTALTADPGLERLEAWMLDSIARPDAGPAAFRTHIWTRLIPARLADRLPQILGVVRYDTLRRLRLGIAGLAAKPGGP